MARLSVSPIAVVAGLLMAGSCTGSALAADPAGTADAPSGSRNGLRTGDWLLRGRIVGMIPTERSSHIGLIGGRIDLPAIVLPDVDVSYFLSDHIAVEGQVGAVRTRPAIRDSMVGDLAIGTIWNAAAAGILQYHVLPGARLNPYLGVGVAAATPLSIEPAKGVAAFKVKSQVSPLIQIGFDYHLTGNWFGNAMAKYIFNPRQSYELGGVTVESHMNMLIVGAGIGYRF